MAAMASLRRNPSRAARSASARSVVEEDDWIPDLGSPRYTDADRRLDSLNKEAFPSKIFCQADNLLMYALFAGKGKKRRYNKGTPGKAEGPGNSAAKVEPPMPPEEGRKAAAICKHLMDYNPDKPEATWEDVGRAVLRLQEEIPSFQSGERLWSACLQQCVILYYLLRICL
jgi:hypothetical protein